jgi:hypothetical protein
VSVYLCTQNKFEATKGRERERGRGYRELPECLTAPTPLPLPPVRAERIPIPNVKSKNFWAPSESAVMAA